jgi:hypothetical protein
VFSSRFKVKYFLHHFHKSAWAAKFGLANSLQLLRSAVVLAFNNNWSLIGVRSGCALCVTSGQVNNSRRPNGGRKSDSARGRINDSRTPRVSRLNILWLLKDAAGTIEVRMDRPPASLKTHYSARLQDPRTPRTLLDLPLS